MLIVKVNFELMWKMRQCTHVVCQLMAPAFLRYF